MYLCVRRSIRSFSPVKVFQPRYRYLSTNTENENKETTTTTPIIDSNNKRIWETISASSNTMSEAFTQCCTQLKQKMKDNKEEFLLPNTSNSIALVFTSGGKPMNQLCSLPEVLEKEGICSANKVFGGSYFQNIFDDSSLTAKKFSLSVTLIHWPGVSFHPFKLSNNEFPFLDFKENNTTEQADNQTDENSTNSSDQQVSSDQKAQANGEENGENKSGEVSEPEQQKQTKKKKKTKKTEENVDEEIKTEESNEEENNKTKKKQEKEQNEETAQEKQKENDQDQKEEKEKLENEESDDSDYEIDDVVEKYDTERYLMMFLDGNEMVDNTIVPKLDILLPNVKKFGCITNPSKQEQTVRFFEGTGTRGGSIGLYIEGDIKIDLVHSVGYFPLGEAFTITETHHQEVRALNGLVAVDAIDNRLEAFGFNAQDTPVLYKVISRPTNEKIPLRQNDTIPLLDNSIHVSDPVYSGDKIQFYAYDYRRIITDIGEKLSPYANTNENPSKNKAIAFGSLPNMDELYVPVKGSDAPKVVFIEQKALNAFNLKDIPEISGQEKKSKPKNLGPPCDPDYYPDPKDIKNEVFRIASKVHQLDFTGAIGRRTFIDSGVSPAETTITNSAVSVAIFQPKQ